MIYTVTFNPALDYILRLDHFKTGITNRANREEILAGGKGINVSIVLNNLGVDNVAMGFIAGFTGDEVEKELRQMGCRTNFIKLPNGMTRINVKIQEKEETEINGIGPNIGREELDLLLEKLNSLKAEDVLVLAGNIPKTLPNNVYEEIMEYLEGRNVRIVVDATKELLLNSLKLQPFLIKPNKHELSEMFGVTLSEREEIIKYAQILREKGAKNVLVSMGGEGAFLISEEGKVYERDAPKGKLVNSVGAGDSMVAGFLAGHIDSKDYGQAFKMGIATGSASAFSSKLATKEEVQALLKKMKYN